MTITRTIQAKDAAKNLRMDKKLRKKAFMLGLRAAAVRGGVYLGEKSDEMGITYRGRFKNSWRTRKSKSGKGFENINRAPHAGIVELGARPHKVSREGREAIYQWVRRKVWGVSPTAARENSFVDQMVWGIIKKIEREGQKPTYLVRNSLPQLKKLIKVEVESSINRAIRRGSV